jgi:hypothetical protein
MTVSWRSLDLHRTKQPISDDPAGPVCVEVYGAWFHRKCFFSVHLSFVIVGHPNAGKIALLEQLKVKDVLPSLPWNETRDATTTTCLAEAISPRIIMTGTAQLPNRVQQNVCSASCTTNNLRQCGHDEDLDPLWNISQNGASDKSQNATISQFICATISLFICGKINQSTCGRRRLCGSVASFWDFLSMP